jgi:ABC-type phosphate transport system auxiliary subunit
MNRLEARRAQLFAELTAIEQQHRDGEIDAGRYARRRAEVVSALERIYAELDRQAA